MKNSQFKACLMFCTDMDLDDLLGEISVQEIDDDSYGTHLIGWYAVTNTSGIIAFFGNKIEAYKYRLDYINRIINN